MFCTKLMKSRSWLWLIDVAPKPSSNYLCTSQALTGLLYCWSSFCSVSHKDRHEQLGPIATPLISEKISSRKEKAFLVRTNLARRQSVSVGGCKAECLLRKYCNAFSPPECGMHVYKDGTSVVNKYFGSKFWFCWWIPSVRLKAWVLNFMSVGSGCTSGCRATSRYSKRLADRGC